MSEPLILEVTTVSVEDVAFRRPGEKRRREDATEDVLSVMRTALTKSEFASALGMRENDVFVKKMFRIVDKDRDGRISFQVRLK